MSEAAFTSVQTLKLQAVAISTPGASKIIPIILQHVAMIELSETILEPGIVGVIDILDWQGLEEFGNIAGGDKITIEWGSMDDKPDTMLKGEFSIYSIEDCELSPKQTYNTLRIGFCSPWLIDAYTMQVSKVWENKTTTEMIEDLIKLCGGKIGIVENSITTLEHFVSPLWAPWRTISYLMSISESLAGSGYICWTDLSSGKVNVTTLDYILSGKVGKYKPEFKTEDRVANPRYEGLVKHITVESKFDIIRQVQAGGSILKIHGFNFDEGKPFVTKTSMTGLKNKHIGSVFPLNKKFLDPKYATNKISGLFPQTAKPTVLSLQVTGLVDNQMNNAYAMLATDVFKLTFYSAGAAARRAGWLCKLDLASTNATDKQGSVPMKGEYLICNIVHMFSGLIDYKQVITVVADGYKEHKHPELIRW